MASVEGGPSSIKPHNIGTLVARVSAQYRCFRDIECMNLVWTDLGDDHISVTLIFYGKRLMVDVCGA